MVNKNKKQGLLVIGVLSIAAVSLGGMYVQTYSQRLAQQPQTKATQSVESTVDTAKAVARQERTMDRSMSGNKYGQAQEPHTLGTIGKQNDPKFKGFVKMIEDYEYQGSVLFIRNGQPVWHQGFGEMAPGESYKPDAPIALTSLSKNITAYLLMKELTRQKVSLDTPLARFYPELPGANKHTLRDVIRMDAPYDGQGYAEDTMTEEEYRAFYLKNLTYTPNPTGKWHYNSADFQLLTNVLHKLTNKPYDDLVKRQIKPEYDILTVNEFAKAKDRAIGYYKNGDEVLFDKQKFEREVGTGSLFMSDWQAYRFIRDQIQGRNLTAGEFTNLTQPRPNKPYGYAGGMYVKKYGYKLHGVLEGFEPSMILDKTGQNGVILFSNFATGDIDTELAQPMFDKWQTMK